MTRAGFVTLVGKPNAGKSTLLNRLVGERLAIVSPKPQSTRERVVGILTQPAPSASGGDATQIVLLDTPGLLEPRYALHRAMRHAAQLAIADADVIVHLVDSAEDAPRDLATLAGLPAPPRAPVILALNKCDRLSAERREALVAVHPDACLISASDGQGIDALLERIRAALPPGPFLYPEDDISTQQMRFFVREFVRESVLEQLEDELPYGVAVEIEEYREGTVPVYIRAVMHVERESQKRILIGAGGSRIKSIGAATRAKLEPLVGSPVFLDLWVKVLPNWRRNPNALARLGYRVPTEGSQ
jgi:GTP-binding protein Era